ncbi:MAG: hypothetical protein ACYTBS_28170, partial [Planctomycetota bacterium]
MAKEADQTQTIEAETPEVDAAAEAAAKEEADAVAAATKTSSDFDKKLDAEGVDDETPPADKTGDDDESAAKEADATKDEPEAKGDDKDAAAAEKDDQKAAAKDDDSEQEPKVSKELSTRAANLGLTPEEIAEFGSDEELTRTLNVLDGIIADAEGQETPAQRPAQEPAETTKDTKDAKAEDDTFKLEFKNEEDIDPEILANLKGMAKHQKDVVERVLADNKALREQVEGMTASM